MSESDLISLSDLSHPPGAEVSARVPTLPSVLRILTEVSHVIHGVCHGLTLLQRPLHCPATKHLLLQLLQFSLDVFVTQPVTMYV